MFFKPRIFISSLLKNRLDIRKKIEDVLANAGAEVLLYERNLTPSIDNNVYRSDIKDADFVIIMCFFMAGI